MGVPGSINNLLGAAPVSYKVERSLRFNSSDSAFCSRTPSSAGNRRTWTLSLWVKRSGLGAYQRIFNSRNPGVAADYIRFNNDDTLELYLGAALITTQVFRDPSSWYHLVIAVDTTQATSGNRVKLYVNGSQVSTFGTANYPSQNADTLFNATLIHTLGTGDGTTEYFSGYLANVEFVDGQQLTSSSFTETSATTGQLIPKKYTGTFTGNSFWLPFSDNSSTTSGSNVGIGKDFSGLGNYWNTTNLSVTAGAGNDSLVDTPTSYGTDTGAGGEVRGNYATLNPLKLGSSLSLANGNLDVSASGSSITSQAFSTIAVNSGLWYFEVTVSTNTNANATIGVATPQASQATYAGQDANSWGFSPWSGSYYLYINGVQTNPSAPGLTQTGTFGFAFDASSGKFWATDQAGTWLASGNPATGANPLISSITTTNGLLASVGHYSPGSQTTAQTVNFGQRQWAYAAPLGFEALVDTNIPVVIAKPETVFQVIRYTGNGSTQTIPNANTVPTTLAFSPDLVWIKDRGAANFHVLVDAVRSTGSNGSLLELYSNATNAEGNIANRVTGLTSTGFTLGSDANQGVNNSNASLVAWTWDAGTTTTTINANAYSAGVPSITSSVRANASAGFSVATWTGTGSGSATVGHGLGVAPRFMIVKDRNLARNWIVYHTSLGATSGVVLNGASAASGADAGWWNNTAPTSTVATIGIYGNEASNYVGYFWAPVVGYSSFGSYTGNGSADGPFVYTGFRPRFVLFKRTDSVSSGDWVIYDTARDPYNVCQNYLLPNSSGAEAAFANVDYLSNGFKLKSTGSINTSGGTWIYAAFAENPFQYARAR